MLADKISKNTNNDYLKDYLKASASLAKVGGISGSPTIAKRHILSSEIKIKNSTVIRIVPMNIKVNRADKK